MTKTYSKALIFLSVFLVLLLLNSKSNLRRRDRSKQYGMPVVALVYSIVALVSMQDVLRALDNLLRTIPVWLDKLARWCAENANQVTDVIADLARELEIAFINMNIDFWICMLANLAIFAVYIIVKRACTLLMKLQPNESFLHDLVTGPFYDYDEQYKRYHLKDTHVQAARLTLVVYCVLTVVSLGLFIVTEEMYLRQLLSDPFCPVFGILVVGEIYFFLNGMTRREALSTIGGEDDTASRIVNYALLREFLKKLFGDKLNAEDTTSNYDLSVFSTNDELLTELQQADTTAEEAYGVFMERLAKNGLAIDQNLLISGRDLLRGKSILFNDPFYADLIPYAFYPMNRTLLRGKKVLVVLGRHGAEDEIAAWCAQGIAAVTGIPTMWDIGVLDPKESTPDIGILTRSAVHDLALHTGCEEFFGQVEYLVILEPSRLVTTAQIGLNSIVKRCKGGTDRPLVCCSVDKNCDGLVDALSHVLMTDITEVAPTGHFTGASSYMCWDATGDHLQHRMLPNIARYLGTGTELSFAALKNQVSHTVWYGGDAFPVRDMHWIGSQYYHELLSYAGLPANQRTYEDRFAVSASLWNAPRTESAYLVVEDEANNMFEMRRAFATRAEKQGFVNIISADYMLKDYMADNERIFRTDPKAIPAIVADYARTRRNVILRLLLMMSTGALSEDQLRKELLLLHLDTAKPLKSFWAQLCDCYSPLGQTQTDLDGEPVLVGAVRGKERIFTAEVIQTKRRYNAATGLVEPLYSLQDPDFIACFLQNLQSAGYLAEDEQGNQHYLGSELRDHVFQRYLPGQLFTFDGKYYEMLSLAADGHVIVRRAADHIHGRPFYRQIRHYNITAVETADEIAAVQNVAGLRITRQYADFTVDTPAYWRMDSLKDFTHAKMVEVSGIPRRSYCRKRILKIDLPGADAKILATVTMLFNEAFHTLFAQDQPYIVAVTGNTDGIDQLTCSLAGGEAGSIYLLEDSMLDLGLLVAAERNLERIFRIVCDYLQWHFEAVELSKNPPAPQPPPPMPEEPAAQEEKPGIFVRIWRAIKKFFVNLWKKLTGFFKGLFKPKQKAGPQSETAAEGTVAEGEAAQPAAESAASAEGEMPQGQAPAGQVNPFAAAAAAAQQDAEKQPAGDETAQPAAGAAADASMGEAFEQLQPQKQGKKGRKAKKRAKAEQADAPQGDTPLPPLASRRPSLASIAKADAALAAIGTEKGDTLSFSPDGAVRAGDQPALDRKPPYHTRYFLLFGADTEPEKFDYAATLSYLQGLGFGESDLAQARRSKDTAERIARTYVPNKAGVHYCDFCGVELSGTEYDVLNDGRERCTICGQSIVKTEEEFVRLYKIVLENLSSFYGIRIQVPIRVRMVNSKTLHRKLGEAFVPTNGFDGRVLGVAIRDKREDSYTIYLENGSPRMMSVMTMAHELTHIWQYVNWDDKKLVERYGANLRLEIYEGMAKWVEIQYAALIGEAATAKREELITIHRDDEYGRGFIRYLQQYPLSYHGQPADTPFKNDPPLEL